VDLRGKLGNKITRMPVVDADGVVQYIAHQSGRHEFLAEQAIAGKPVAALTQRDLADDAELQNWIPTSRTCRKSLGRRGENEDGAAGGVSGSDRHQDRRQERVDARLDDERRHRPFVEGLIPAITVPGSTPCSVSRMAPIFP
jgi:hypothetical protein